MPRRYDFSRNPLHSRQSYIWHLYNEQRPGRGEVDTSYLWGPGSIFLMSGQRHQFELQMPRGSNPYDNAVVEPIFAWLDSNTTGAWHWIEGETNNNRSVYTNVFLEEPDDIEAFKARWGDIFEYSERQTLKNEAWRQAQADAHERAEMPSHVTPSSMRYIMIAMRSGTADWFDAMKDRAGFDEVFAEGLSLAASDFAAFPVGQSEHGPRMADGTLHPGLLEDLRSLGEWIRTSGTASLKEKLTAVEITDPEMAEAIGSFEPLPDYAARP